jgi:hypothetical protein
MKMTSCLAVLLSVLAANSNPQTSSVASDGFSATSALSNKVAHFELTDATLLDALSKLSFEPIAGLHLGIEEIIRGKDSEPTDRSVRFSLNLHDVPVRYILGCTLQI